MLMNSQGKEWKKEVVDVMSSDMWKAEVSEEEIIQSK